MTKKINITFIFLIVSMILAFAITEIGMKNGDLVISLFAILKFLLVGFFFMEVIKSHLIWKIVMLFFCLVYFITIMVLY